MLVFIKNNFQAQCEFGKKDFKRHVWRCQARLLNRETSIDSIITTSVGQSIVTSNHKAMPVNLFNNEYDPHKSEETDHHYRCYCGREFTTLRGLNIHRRFFFYLGFLSRPFTTISDKYKIYNYIKHCNKS